MSLAEKSDGILETHVHWEEIEEQMQKSLETTATFGPNKTAKDIGIGNGFVSRIALINPDWQNGSDNLPKTFVAKICSALALIEFSQNGDKQEDLSGIVEKILIVGPRIHNTEVDTYQILKKYDEGRIPLPKIYATRKFSDENKTRGYILMEYFDDLVSCHIYDVVDVESIKKALRSIAIWQAVGLKLTDEERNKFTKTSMSENLSDVFSAEMIERTGDGFRSFLGPDYSEITEQYVDVLRKYCNKENFTKLDFLSDKLGCKRVLCHGDLWCTNILWTKTNGAFDIKAHIDFQATSFNGLAMDINRVISACLSGSDRRKNYKDLLKTFYSYLEEEVDGEMPYSYEQLEHGYKYYTPLSASMNLMFVNQIYTFISNKFPESAEKIKETLLEKTVALMEDAVDSQNTQPL
ncbi:unnamed protein product [Auanema sp. JU1783]|nr:unnamed protein product [Auanema sp. JU1783]